ncbi:hypothetical protein Droror1_Dr00008598 [Drosera rotundifolia]
MRITKFSSCVVGFIEDKADLSASNASDLSPTGQRVDKTNISPTVYPVSKPVGPECDGLKLKSRKQFQPMT